MEICCPGPSSTDILWIPCGTSGPGELIAGYAGLSTSSKGEHCQLVKLTWTTAQWTLDASPAVGDTVGFQSAMYFVAGATRSGCTVVLVLCRAVLECPNCSASLYRLVRLQDDCLSRLVAQVYATEVPGLICTYDQVRRVIDNAEVLIESVRICLDTTHAFEVGDLVVCDEDVWRIDRIESRCGAMCVANVIGIREPWSILDAAEAPEPFDALGTSVLVLPAIEIDTDGELENPPFDAIANPIVLEISGILIESVGTHIPFAIGVGDLEISGIQIAGVGDYLSPVEGVSEFSISGLQLSGTGSFVPARDGVGNLNISGLQLQATGFFAELITGTSEFDISGLQLTATGVNNSPQAGVGDFDISGIQMQAVGEVVNVPSPMDGVGDLVISGIQIQSVGFYQAPFIGVSDVEISGLQLQAIGDFLAPFQGVSDFAISGLQLQAAGNSFVPFIFDGTTAGCGVLHSSDVDVIVTHLGDTISLGEDCTMEISGLQLSAQGTTTFLFTGSMDQEISGLQLSAVGTFKSSFTADGVMDAAISGLQFDPIVGLFNPMQVVDGHTPPCNEAWITELDDVVITETGDEIVFSDAACGMNLAGIQMSASGAFSTNPNNRFGTGDFEITGLQMQSVGQYDAPPEPNVGTSSLLCECVTTAGLVQVNAPVTFLRTGTGTLLLDCTTTSGDVVVSDPPVPRVGVSGPLPLGCTDTTGVVAVTSPPTSTIVAMTGGWYEPEGLDPAQHPTETVASMRFQEPGLPDLNALMLTLPLTLAQGQPVGKVILRAAGDDGSGVFVLASIRAYATDNAPATSQSWLGEDVSALPRTDAVTGIGIQGDGLLFAEDIDVTEIVQEIVDRPLWVSGNRIMFIIDINFDMFPRRANHTFRMSEVGGIVTELEILPDAVWQAATWTRGSYWSFRSITPPPACGQAIHNPRTADAIEGVLRTQGTCPLKIQESALGIAVIGMDEIAVDGRIRIATDALAGTSTAYYTDNVAVYYHLGSFSETTYETAIPQSELDAAGTVQIPWHWIYNENNYVISGLGPVLQAMQLDPAYVLGQPFRLLFLPLTTGNWGGSPSALLQGLTFNKTTAVFEWMTQP